MRNEVRYWASCCAAAGCALATSAYAAPIERVLSIVQEEKPAVLETLRQLVNIESASRDSEGLDRIAELIRGRLVALGGTVEIVEPGADAVRLFDTPARIGKAVVARFDGSGGPTVMLLAHMDTVYARGTLARRPFRIEGSRAYGPGVADEKGGVALALHTVAVLGKLGFRGYRKLTVVVNGDEELSTPGARGLITRLASQHDVVLSFEPSPAPRDELALATNGIAAATMTVRGRAAHAGVNPEDGRNALLELAHQLLATRSLGDASRGIKFNWTVAQAGTTRNVIPDAASANADVRVRRAADFDAIEKAFREAIARDHLIPETTVEASFERRRPPLEAMERSRALAKKAQAIYGELGRTLGLDESGRGAGTDAAFASLSGKPAVVENCGLLGFNYHTPEAEFVDLDSIEPRLYLSARLVMESTRD
ncbi:MAG TPA: glutamate carboxypeptidase [Myxococcales bacterium]|nr:glutamate carboxypeptidase [Myxococcales bacterium]